jgi:hypothetical protein
MGSSQASAAIRRGLLACILAASIVAVAGCEPPRGGPVASSEPEAGIVLGPYPSGLTVACDGVRFTLKSVEVSDSEASYEPTEPITVPAPEGYRWVYVKLTVEGATDRSDAGAPPLFPTELQLVADGQPMQMDQLSSGGDIQAPPGVAPTVDLRFLAPEEVRSLVLRVTPSFLESQTVAFLLW